MAPSPSSHSPSSSKLPPPLPPRSGTSTLPASTPGTHPKLSKSKRLILSFELILSTLDQSTKQVLDGGTQGLGSFMGHRYGPEAGSSTVLLAGTARNVALVYIDMRGIGRKALLKMAAKEYIKAEFEKGKTS